jgi:hypothetical protein
MARKLNVSTLFRDTAHASSVPIPHLRLTGQWLEAAGFSPGARVRVVVHHGQLIISPEVTP